MKKRMLMLLTLFSAVATTALADVSSYYFEARLGKNILVTLIFDINDDNIAAGYIYYPKAKTPAPILVVGYQTTENNGDGPFWVMLDEYLPDGVISGRMYLQLTRSGEEQYALVSGTWVNPKTEKELTFADAKSFPGVYLPDWYPGCELVPADPGKIGKYYSYQIWNPRYESMMGGHVEFRAAGKNKVHFSVVNVPQNIAEGESEAGRPAVLNGNTFDYLEVNECHYGFRAYFFERFVVLRTIAGLEELSSCFGMGVAFDGVYIKIKK